MRHCPKCQTDKAETEFYVSGKGKLSSYCRDCMKAHQKAWAINHRQRKNEINAGWRRKHPHRRKLANDAGNKLWAALRKGHVVRGTICERCGSSDKIQAAHADYSKPLAVTWLCIKCHRVWDAKQPKTLLPSNSQKI